MSSVSSLDSLFDDCGDLSITEEEQASHGGPAPASRTQPPIPGLYVFPSLLPVNVAHDALVAIAEANHFVGGTRDQVMLFEAAPSASRPGAKITGRDQKETEEARGNSRLPQHISALDGSLGELLQDHLPEDVHKLAFEQSLARQAILNLYPPGQGITPHIDLLGRYADGIVGASLVGGCVMRLERDGEAYPSPTASERHLAEQQAVGLDEKHLNDRYDVYLPPRSVYVFTGEARWGWSHGIEGRSEDLVLDERGEAETLPRSLRVSVTLRWMKSGAEVVG